MRISSAFIVRDLSEVYHARLALKGPALLLCTNRQTMDHCRQNSYPSVLLEEELLAPLYGTLNDWAVRQVFRLNDVLKEDPEARLFLESNFIPLNALFIQTLKNILILKDVARKKEFQEILLFDDKDSLLVLILREYTRIVKPDWNLTILPKKAKREKSATIKETLFRILSFCVNFTSRRRMEKVLRKGSKFVLASGAINHLSALLVCLRSKCSHDVVWYENRFNLEKFNFCRRHGMIFLIGKTPIDKRRPFKFSGPLFANGSVIYEGMDYSTVMSAVFDGLFEMNFFKLDFDPQEISELMTKYPFLFTLLDEDWAMRRVFTLLSDHLSKRCYVVSHGVPVVLYNEAGASPAVRHLSSPTFVNSDFEKAQYERHFYDPTKLIVTGVPRYDEIFDLKNSCAQNAPLRKVKNILYCGASMGQLDFDNFRPWLGLKNSLGESTRKYTRDLLDIVSGMKDVSLKIKPHYNQEDVWNQFLAQNIKPWMDCQLLSYKDNIFKLEAQADVILTIESSVISEALMFDKPVIVLNYALEDRVLPYDNDGVVEHVRNKEQLKDSIGQCLNDTFYLQGLAKKRQKVFSYYAGPWDGRNTERITDHILSEVKSCGTTAVVPQVKKSPAHRVFS